MRNQEKRYHSRYMLFVMLIFYTLSMYSQKITVKGKVIDAANNLEVIGAAVQVEGNSLGTITDIDGNFVLQGVPEKGNLVFSFVGYKTVKAAIKNGKFYNIKLQEDTKVLDEVVVVGYGSMRKKEVTGAVARVNSEEITKISTSDLGTALQGMVAGVNVQASSGEPGAKSNIQIRGISSISGSSAPLYVVDGVPFEGDPGLSNNEIASIDILKDAASAAIYGTRGASGVILITTKKGKEGEMKVALDGYYGFQHITSKVHLLDANEETFVTVMANRMAETKNTDDLAWSSLKNYPVNFFNNTRLYDCIINNNAPIQNYSANFSGGQKNLTYNMTVNYFDQEGVLINSDYKRYNIRSNTNFKRGKWNINANLAMQIEDQLSPAWALLNDAYDYSPLRSPVDPNLDIFNTAGDPGEIQGISYTLGRLKERNDKNTESFNGNFYIAYGILPGLSVSTRLSFGYLNQKMVMTRPEFEVYNQDGERVVSSNYRSQIKDTHSKNTSMTWESMVNYNRKIKKHDFKFTGVFSMEKYTYEMFFASIMDLYTNEIPNLNAGSSDMSVGTGDGQWGQDRTSTLIGILARLQYSYADKYMVSVSVRRDGSSKFSKENRWGMFPSLSLGWNISEERFWDRLRWMVNSFKLRLSYGTTGNQNFADYSYAPAIYKNYDYAFGTGAKETLVNGLTQLGFANPNVKWETTQQLNAGIDLAFMNNKLILGLDVYKSNKKNMLFPMVVPPSSGGGQNSTVTLNAGNMENKGVELSLTHRNKIHGVNYSLTGTFTKNKNEITSMAGKNSLYFFSEGKPIYSGSDYVTAIKEGYEAGAFFVMPTNGVINTEQKLAEYQKLVSSARMGDLMYVDTNKDGILNDDDRVYAGSGMPDFELGLNFAADYKGFDFSMNWYASVGNDIINATKIYSYQKKTSKDLIYMWTPTNNTSTIPSYRNEQHNNYRAHTDMWVEDGSFVRLKNIMLGYSLPKKVVSKLRLGKCRFYIAADNLLTLTKYDGYDPEVGSNGLFDWAIRSNMASVLTDCPHREKLGWLEEAHLMQYSVQYRYNLARLYEKTFNDMRSTQAANGMIPTIAPELVEFEGGFKDTPEWGSTFVISPWYIYQWYGDTRPIETYYPDMQRYIDYLSSKADNHIIAYGLGDWFDIGPESPGESQLTSNGVTATAIYYYDVTLMEKMANLLGKPDDARKYQELAARIKQAFNRTFWNPSTRTYDRNSQAANAVALYMGLTTPENRQQVFDNLIADIRGRNNALTETNRIC